MLSLDTLRGFDMLFIMGFAPLVVALNRCYPTAVGDWLAGQMSHTAWHGFTQHDLIFLYSSSSPVSLSRSLWPSSAAEGCPTAASACEYCDGG